MSELYPSMDEALTSARLYLTEKAVVPAHVAAFETRLADVIVPDARREALVREWKERMNNTGRLTGQRAEREADLIRAYAANHRKHVREFVSSWLEVRRGGSEECDTRLRVLRRALLRAL